MSKMSVESARLERLIERLDEVEEEMDDLLTSLQRGIISQRRFDNTFWDLQNEKSELIVLVREEREYLMERVAEKG